MTATLPVLAAPRADPARADPARDALSRLDVRELERRLEAHLLIARRTVR